MDLADRFSTTDVSGDEFEYRIHMDYTKSYANSDLTKDGNGYTTFSIADYYPQCLEMISMPTP